jgi:hypothetical protein
MPAAEITDEDTDTESLDSGPEDVEEIVIAKMPRGGGKKRKITTTKKEAAVAASAAAAMMIDEDIITIKNEDNDGKNSDALEESMAVRSTLKECLSLMGEMKRKAAAPWVPTTPTTPAGTSCFYCYAPEHYASFCSLKIKHNSERLSSQKRVAAAKKKQQEK